MKAMKVFLLGLAVLFSVQVMAQSGDEVVKVGDAVPAFTVQMADGTTVHIGDLKGKVVLINFWATWCPPCRAEFKRIPAEIVEAFQGQDFVLLAISREEPLETVTGFMKENGYTFPVGIDPDRAIFAKFALNSIPRNYLVDKQGKIAAVEVGYAEHQFNELIGKIKAELAK